MTAVDETIYDEPVAPSANGAPADPHLCPECGQRFEGPAWGMRRGAHRRKDHGVIGTRQKERAAKSSSPPSSDEGIEERAPRTPPKARVKLDDMGTGLWRGLAWISARTDKMAASRMFTLLAPAAGPAFERAMKGTLPDRLVFQPLARAGNNGKDAAVLVGAPLAAQAFLESPNALTHAAFVGSLEAALPIIVKTAKDAKKRADRLEQDLSDLAEVFGKAPGESVSITEVARWVCTGSTVEFTPEEEAAA